MVLSRKDLLWSSSIPFRIKNKFKITEDEFILGLCYDHFEGCSFTDAKKILHLALQEGFVSRENGFLIFKNADIWSPPFPLDWSPDFNLLQDVEEEPLQHLPKTEPLIIEKPPPPKPLEVKPISRDVMKKPAKVKTKTVPKTKKPKKQEKKLQVEEEKPKKIKKKKPVASKPRKKKKKKSKAKTLDAFFN
ncbi:MAG: DUF2240 family protein [Candidatus Helarchaeota archaeon]